MIEYEVKAPLLDSREAREKDAVLVYQKRSTKKNIPNANEGPLFPERWEGNLRGPLGLFSYKDGAARRAIEEAKTKGFLAQGCYQTQLNQYEWYRNKKWEESKE